MVALYRRTFLSSTAGRLHREPESTRKPNMGILTFEAARAMSRLIGLHRFLLAPEIAKLRSFTMRSTGVTYLVSTDQLFLLRLTCAELLDDLDRTTSVVSRLEERSSISCPREFRHLFSELRTGTGDLGLGFGTKGMERGIKKMENYVRSTLKLQAEMEILSELERCDNIQKNRNINELLIASQRQLVRKLQTQAGSLWCETSNNVTSLMARAIVTVFSRICSIFAPVMLELPLVVPCKNGRYRFSDCQLVQHHFSAPLNAGHVSLTAMRTTFSGTLEMLSSKEWSSSVLEAPSGTVGGSGMALRYQR